MSIIKLQAKLNAIANSLNYAVNEHKINYMIMVNT